MADTLKEQSSFLERGDSCLSLVDIESSDAQSELSELDDSMAESMAEFDLDQDSEVSSVNGGETEATKEIPAAEVNESSSKGPVSTVEGTNRQGKGIPVFRMSSSDSLFGQLFGSRRNENAAPLQPPKTRRGGRRSNATTPAEGPSNPNGVSRDSILRILSNGVEYGPRPSHNVESSVRQPLTVFMVWKHPPEHKPKRLLRLHRGLAVEDDAIRQKRLRRWKPRHEVFSARTPETVWYERSVTRCLVKKLSQVTVCSVKKAPRIQTVSMRRFGPYRLHLHQGGAGVAMWSILRKVKPHSGVSFVPIRETVW